MRLLLILLVTALFGMALSALTAEDALVIDMRGRNVEEPAKCDQPLHVIPIKVVQESCPHLFVTSTCLAWTGGKNPNRVTCNQCGKVLNP